MGKEHGDRADDRAICDDRITSLLEVIYDLGGTEIQCLVEICRRGNLRVESLAEELNRDRSTVQKALNQLISFGLVERKARCCQGPKRGRYYTYSPIRSGRLRDELKARLDSWYRDRIEAIDRI